MAEIATLARPYAKAVFELAKSQARLGPWGDMLALLAAVASQPLVEQLLESPDIPEPDKARQWLETRPIRAKVPGLTASEEPRNPPRSTGNGTTPSQGG
jgi:hypothetical protein